MSYRFRKSDIDPSLLLVRQYHQRYTLIPLSYIFVIYISASVAYVNVTCRRRIDSVFVFQAYAVVTCAIKLFQNYFRGLGLLQLMNIFQHVQCRCNNFGIISSAEIIIMK